MNDNYVSIGLSSHECANESLGTRLMRHDVAIRGGWVYVGIVSVHNLV